LQGGQAVSAPVAADEERTPVNANAENPVVAMERYDRTTVRLHWASAVLVALLWGSAQIIDFFDKGPPRWNMLGVHMTLGVALSLVLVYRLFWRLTGATRLPEPDQAWMRWTARATHYGLYILLIVQLLLGFFNAWVRGDHVFTWFQIPAFDPGNKVLRHDAGERHDVVANIILVVAGLHACAALFHHYGLRDGVLRRMRMRE
jgi:cytochrome b561